MEKDNRRGIKRYIIDYCKLYVRARNKYANLWYYQRSSSKMILLQIELLALKSLSLSLSKKNSFFLYAILFVCVQCEYARVYVCVEVGAGGLVGNNFGLSMTK